MTMTDFEIVQAYRDAKDKKMQIGILAEMNVCRKGDEEKSEKYYIVNPKRCRDCVYGWMSYCTYILITGHRRPCPPGDECTVRITIKDARQRIRQRSFDGQFDKERPERPEKQLTRKMKTYWQEHPCTAAALKKAFPDCNFSRKKVQSYITRWRKHDQAQKEL